ncbi:hypothetical protein TNCV_84761 [Trichonephila clavipes]|nr:hypothetical protein TNCV_84761 [Trichonephila clavipes]
MDYRCVHMKMTKDTLPSLQRHGSGGAVVWCDVGRVYKAARLSRRPTSRYKDEILEHCTMPFRGIVDTQFNFMDKSRPRNDRVDDEYLETEDFQMNCIQISRHEPHEACLGCSW